MARARRLLPLVVLALLGVPASASAAAPIQVGVGRADITPPTGYYMMGWVRSDGVIAGANTRLWARVIVLRQGGRKVALVSEDLNGIPGGMMKQAADADRDIGFSEQNVLDSASHTHAAPTSFYNFSTYNSVFMTLRSPTDFDLQGTRDQSLYAFMVQRLALAIRRANANLGPGAVGWGTVQIPNLTVNRSIEAHLYDHGIHLPYGQGSPSQDPLGPLHTIDPEGNVLRVDKQLGGRRVPVGIWSTFANHGTVNKFQFTYYNEDHHGAATHGVETAIRHSGHVPANQPVVGVYGNSDEGDISSGLTRSGPAAADFVGQVEAAAFMRAWRDAGAHMQRSPTLDWRWTRMCFCGQQTAEGPVSDRAGFGLSEFTGSEEGRGPLFDVTRVPFEGDHLPVGVPNDPQGDKINTSIPLDVPKAVPLMTLRLGDRMIASVPGEMTEEMGRRVRAAVLAASAGAGVTGTVISGLANEYADYFTTPEEYDAQHYEGAATVYGRTSSVAIQEKLTELAADLTSGRPAPQAYAYDPTDGVAPGGTPFPSGAARASVLAQPAAAAPLAHAEFAWQGAPRGFDRPLDTEFVRIERQVTVAVPRPRRPARPRGRRRSAPAFTGRARVRHRWETVESDLGLNIVWSVDRDGRYTARWEVPLAAAPGSYRFAISANHYALTSRVFRVGAASTLTVTRAYAPPGSAALRLGYPAAVSHEAVGDPPGDFTADLTFRPQYAPTGTATVTVGGRTRTVHATGGVFSFPAPAGSAVQVAPGAVRDAHGNANGNALSFSP